MNDPRGLICTCRRGAVKTFAAKELHFNKNGEALKRMQAGVDKLATVVGVTLGPKVQCTTLTKSFCNQCITFIFFGLPLAQRFRNTLS